MEKPLRLRLRPASQRKVQAAEETPLSLSGVRSHLLPYRSQTGVIGGSKAHLQSSCMLYVCVLKSR